MKRLPIVLLGGFVLGVLGAGTYLFLSRQQAVVPGGEDAAIAPTAAPARLLWDDPAGFTVTYPESLTVDTHDEDKENYAHVEFTDKAHPGNIIIWVKDLPKKVTDTASWGSLVSTPASALTFDTTLGGKPAQKVLISGPKKSVSVGVVYDGVLWHIDADLVDEPYWQPVYDGILDSFVFKPIPEEPAAGAGSTGDYSVDEEEILE